jgi:hypothetical protein
MLHSIEMPLQIARAPSRPIPAQTIRGASPRSFPRQTPASEKAASATSMTWIRLDSGIVVAPPANAA